jgi:hypothetical protein
VVHGHFEASPGGGEAHDQSVSDAEADGVDAWIAPSAAFSSGSATRTTPSGFMVGVLNPTVDIDAGSSEAVVSFAVAGRADDRGDSRLLWA